MSCFLTSRSFLSNMEYVVAQCNEYTVIYSYDNDGKLIKQTYTNLSEECSDKEGIYVEYEYNSNGDILNEYFKKSDGTLISTKSYVYDQNDSTKLVSVSYTQI